MPKRDIENYPISMALNIPAREISGDFYRFLPYTMMSIYFIFI